MYIGRVLLGYFFKNRFFLCEYFSFFNQDIFGEFGDVSFSLRYIFVGLLEYDIVECK